MAIDHKTVKPLRDDVLLQHKPMHQAVESVIYYKEDIDKSPLQTFIVTAVGGDVKLVKEGDLVVCSWKRITTPFDLEVNGVQKKFGITSEKEIDAILEAE